MEYVTLGEHCDITSSKRVFANQYVDEGIPFYRSREIIEKKEMKDISEPLFISEDLYDTFKKKFGVPQKGDLLLTSVGTLGIPYIVKDEVFYFKDGNLTWMKNFQDTLNSKYLYYWLNSKFGKESLIIRAIGSSQAALTIDILKKYKFLLPERKVQDRIVEILSGYDTHIENNNKRIKLLEKMAEKLYEEWFVRFRFPDYETAKFENGIPMGWNIAKVKVLVNRLPFGTLYKADDTEPSGNVIVIDQSKDAFVGYHNNEPSHTASVDNPIAIFGDHSCKFQLMICPFSLSENVIPYKAKKEATTIFLHYSLCRLIETTEYKRHWTELMSKKILVPPMNLQERFDEYIKKLLENIESLKSQNQNLTTQRDMLLPRLMSGKLEV